MEDVQGNFHQTYKEKVNAEKYAQTIELKGGKATIEKKDDYYEVVFSFK